MSDTNEIIMDNRENGLLCSLTNVYEHLNNNNIQEGQFFQHINNKFGPQVTSTLKSLIQINKKISETKAKIKFLIRCRYNDITPKHIHNINKNLEHFTFKSKTATNKFNKNIQKLKSKILNIEIEDNNISASYLENRRKTIISNIQKLVPLDFLQNFLNNVNKNQQLYRHRLDRNFSSKYTNIEKRSNNKTNTGTNNQDFNLEQDKNKRNWFHNLTDIDIPKNIIEVLSLGQKFNSKYNTDLNSNKKLIIDTIKNVESFLEYNNFSEDETITIRSKVINSLQYKDNSQQKHIRKEDRIFARNLKETKAFAKNNNILFTMADKGNVTVAIKREDYMNKMHKLLGDTKTYKKLNKNPLPALRNTVKHLMKDWNERGLFKNKFHNNELTQTDTILPKMYGLPKIHKIDAPMRPIVSAIGSPTYKIAKILQDTLTNILPKPNSYIENSQDLIKKLQNIHIPDDHIMASFDVTSLFTNVPLNLVKNSLEKRYATIRRHLDIPLNDLLDAATLLMENTFFQFDNCYYQQIYGCAMGSPISCLFSNLVMEDLEVECINKLSFQPIYYGRYVDDVLTIIPKNKVEEMLNTLNGYNNRLQFTFEIEKNNSLNFLELTLTKEYNRISTNWFQKSTFSGRFLHFFSNHPITHKRAQIYSLVDKAITLSDRKHHWKNLNLVRNLLIQNKYPKRFIENNIRKRLFTKHYVDANNNNISTNNKNTSDRRRLILSLPYEKNFYNNISNNLKQHNILTVPKINNNLSNIIKRGKDTNHINQMNNIVYRINCKDCDATYVGESKREIFIRMREHQRNSSNPDKKLVINEHIKNHPTHKFNFDNPDILDHETNWKRRIISEMIHINLQKAPINIKEDTQKLSFMYAPLLNILKEKEKFK